MTPWLFSQCIESHNQKIKDDHDHAAWLMWHGAWLGRVKDYPPLAHFLTDGKKLVPAIDEGAIIERLKAHNQRQKSKVTP